MNNQTKDEIERRFAARFDVIADPAVRALVDQCNDGVAPDKRPVTYMMGAGGVCVTHKMLRMFNKDKKEQEGAK